MHKVCPSREHSATLVMFAIVGHTLGHPQMVQQGCHVPQGHSVSQALLSLILVALEHTVRAPAEQVIRTVSCVILATFVLRSNLRHRKDHVTLGIIALKVPS